MKKVFFLFILAACTASAQPAYNKETDPLKESGNIEPRIVELPRAQEDAILKDVKVSMGFRATLFANSQAANYPVFIAAAPNGTLYVSSDGNGSLGRKPKRGRVIRLRDTDDDGRADETKVFCEVDAPRGLVWDHDRLYLVHPPHLSEFIDADHDGVAEKQNILVKDIAFGYKDRPADHTTNGLSLGMDGWLYIAGGDFGFMKAVGTDGRTLQHRGGGVIRVRPDGTGLEIYSTGTRNIVEVAVSPTLDIFARDNTNDGGGWNVRFHHFVGGGDDHGYPRLFKNFPEECIAPLADYGGGSGCGAVYIDEPGFGEDWNNAPFTCDWGTGAIYKHSLKPKGTTFEEEKKPVPFVKLTRPTDADVDAMSRFYCASWKGATFNWEGPDVGYIVCIKPDDFTPEPLPDFAKATEQELVALLDSPSYRRRLAAQQQLRRLGSKVPGEYFSRIQSKMTPERAEIERMKRVPAERPNPHLYLCAQAQSRDPVYAHVASHLLTTTAAGRYKEIFQFIDQRPPPRSEMIRAMARIHDPEVVTMICERLDKPPRQLALIGARLYRLDLLSALCRLYHREGEWKGDSWGTRPDTRGPFYQPETWSESPRIAAKLKELLNKAETEEAAHLVQELRRNRIYFDDSLNSVLALAKINGNVIPDALALLANAEFVPAEGMNLALEVLDRPDGTPAMVANAIIVMSKTDSAEGMKRSLPLLDRLREAIDAQKEYESASQAFFESPRLENYHQMLEEVAAKLEGRTSVMADAALLYLSSRKSGSPESALSTKKAIDEGWKDTKRRTQILEAIAAIKHQASADKVLQAMDDSDPSVKNAAAKAAKVLKLKKLEDQTAKIGSLKPEQVLDAVLKEKGDLEMGEQVFAKATCVACHTVSADQPPRGPYLGNIAQTYKRAELALNILDPNRTIAQGFASEAITLKDGTAQMGFITQESASEIKVRNIAAQEFTYKVADIAKRDKLPTSMMPPMLMNNFTVKEFASLLDYLESLSRK